MEITRDLSRAEEEELKRWLESSIENIELYNKIKKEISETITRTEHIVIDKEKYWNRIEKIIRKEKKPFTLIAFIRYAAIIIAVISFSGLAYYQFFNSNINNNPETPINMVSTPGLVPGGQKALLVMSDGSNVKLDEEQYIPIKEKDGSVIKSSDNSLNYNTKSPELKSNKQSSKILFNTLITLKGGEYSIELSDGTKVKMNAGSKLVYPVTFQNKVREVELVGEAYFEVKHLDKNTPFVIKTSNYNIEVLGTSFDVMAYTDDPKVVTTLVEGSIKIKDFDSSGNEVIIKPNEQLTLNKVEKGIHVKEVDVNIYTAWKEGRFVFVRQDLSDILKVLSRWYNFEVEYESPELEDIIFTGNMNRYEQLTTALEMIAQTNKVNFNIDENKVRVVKKR